MSKPKTEPANPLETPIVETPPKVEALPPVPSSSVPSIDYDAIADRISQKVLPQIKEGFSSATKEIENLVKPKTEPIVLPTEAPKTEPQPTPKKDKDIFGFEMH